MKNKFDIIKIDNNKKEVCKYLGQMGIGALFLGAGIVGMRYFGEATVNEYNNDASLIALLGYSQLTLASLITSTLGGIVLSESIPRFKESVHELKKNK